jgi:hypothetical protein
MTVLPQLKHDLFEAAQRTLPADGAVAPAPPTAGRGSRLRSARRLVPVAVSVLVTVGVAAVALTALRHGQATHAPRVAISAAQSRAALIDTIGTLRRPQTKADLDPQLMSGLRGRLRAEPGIPSAWMQHPAQPDIPLIRYATTTPWGQKLYFVPLKPHRVTEAIPARPGQQPRPRTQLIPETLELVTPAQRWLQSGLDADMIKAGQLGTSEPAGRRVYGGGTSAVRFIYVVPDGVARVTFVLPRDALPGFPFEPVYAHTLSVSAPVHDNVVAVQVDRQFDRANPPMIWYAANGTVIKRIGNFRTLDHVVPEPLPGPETPLSRAAEKDPSTPNRVWVAPTVGGAHTAFTFHFRTLLNEAYYATRLSGPSCPGQHLFGTNPGEAPEGDSLRGHLYSSLVSPSHPTWCPGTYHLSVTLISESFDHPFKPPAKPFGIATFTVSP